VKVCETIYTDIFETKEKSTMAFKKMGELIYDAIRDRAKAEKL
jgi:hypothetical protein